MARDPRNIGASVRARLLDRARAERSDFQILLTRYALERLLYRLSVSAHRERFMLKGAMRFVTWVADPFRPTRDLALLGYGDDDVEAIADTFRSICAEPVADDGWCLTTPVCWPRRSGRKWNMAACGCVRRRRSPARPLRSRSTLASAMW